MQNPPEKKGQTMTKVNLKPSGHEAAKSFYESLLSWTCFVGWSTSALVRLDQESRKSRKRPSKTRDISKDLRRSAHPGLTRLLVCEGLTDCWIAMDGHRCVATQHWVDLQYLSLKPSNTAACGPSIHHHGDNRPPGLQIEIKGNPWMMTFFISGWMMFSLKGFITLAFESHLIPPPKMCSGWQYLLVHPDEH